MTAQQDYEYRERIILLQRMFDVSTPRSWRDWVVTRPTDAPRVDGLGTGGPDVTSLRDHQAGHYGQVVTLLTGRWKKGIRPAPPTPQIDLAVARQCADSLGYLVGICSTGFRVPPNNYQRRLRGGGKRDTQAAQ